jgi:ankyrin repeat protein
MNTTVIFELVKKNNIQELRKLIKEGININIQETDGHEETALHYACRLGKHEIVEILINEGNADIHIRNSLDETPILLAWKYETVKFLLSKGANLEDESYDGYTILDLACEQGETDTVKLLLEYNVCIDSTDEDRQTPFEIACMCGHVETAKLLLEVGVDIDFIENYDGNTSLITAAKISCNQNNIDIIEFLILEGANIDIINYAEKSFFDYLPDRYQERISNLINSLNFKVKAAKT